MSYSCPDGHASVTGDYCSVCGAPIPAGTAVPPPLPSATPAAGGAAGSPLDLGAAAPVPGAVGVQQCANCGAGVVPGALFCEACGYDFTTGQPPRPLDPPGGLPDAPTAPGAPYPPLPQRSGGTVEWVAEVWIDPDWYASQDVDEPCPSAGMPVVVPVLERSVLVGRVSASRNIHPQIDLSADNGVSRRHAQLTSDGQRWWVEDLQSANGTFVSRAGQGIPDTPLPVGQRVELADDDRVYVGAWTRLVLRRATPEESQLVP